jgi:ankyrin repeat protein
VVSILLEFGADLNSRTVVHFSSLLTLTSGRSGPVSTTLPTMALVLDRGADVHANRNQATSIPTDSSPHTSQTNKTALHYACSFGHDEVARVLIRRGAYLNARDTVLRLTVTSRLNSSSLSRRCR